MKLRLEGRLKPGHLHSNVRRGGLRRTPGGWAGPEPSPRGFSEEKGLCRRQADMGVGRKGCVENCPLALFNASSPTYNTASQELVPGPASLPSSEDSLGESFSLHPRPPA